MTSISVTDVNSFQSELKDKMYLIKYHVTPYFFSTQVSYNLSTTDNGVEP